jgi:ankyrin repeat protein
MVAAELGHGEIVRLLLAAGASVKGTGSGWTPLMWAAYESHRPNADGYAIAMKALLDAGADPNVVSGRGESALSLAIGNRNTGGVILLASRGADPNRQDVMGCPLLSLAVEGEDEAMVKALLDAGANVEARDRDGKTAWVRAGEHASQTLMNCLVRAGARERYDALDVDKAVRSAAGKGELTMMKQLLGTKTAEVVKGQRFATLISWAAKWDRYLIVQFLLEKGADPNVVDESGETPLMTALEDYSSSGREAETRTKLASLLISKGADVNARDSRGDTPLLRAITWDNPMAVRLLLDKKANPNLADDEGNLPLVKAVKKGEVAMTTALLDAGADPDKKDEDGKTAWVHANQMANQGLTALLEKAGARAEFASMGWAGTESKITTLLQTAVTTRAEWTDLWRRAFDKEAPSMDFDRNFVACAFLGHNAGWWYGIRFDEPKAQGKTLIVSYTLVMLRVEARPEAFRNPGYRGQYAMKVFPKPQGSDVIVRGHSPERHFPGLDDDGAGVRRQSEPIGSTRPVTR